MSLLGQILQKINSLRSLNASLRLPTWNTTSDLASVVAKAGTYGSVNIAAELANGRIVAPIDHEDPAHLIMSGTGLTHLGSAEARDKMHQAASAAITDSMRIFLDGVAGGKPALGETGQQPEWFYIFIILKPLDQFRQFYPRDAVKVHK